MDLVQKSAAAMEAHCHHSQRHRAGRRKVLVGRLVDGPGTGWGSAYSGIGGAGRTKSRCSYSAATAGAPGSERLVPLRYELERHAAFP
jgi:hypothetical protein